MFVSSFINFTIYQPLLEYYHLEYLNYCYGHNILANMSFMCFISNSEVHTESWSERFIWTVGVDCSNSVNHDWAQVLSYNKYFLLFLPVVGIEPATSRWLVNNYNFKWLFLIK